jgi:hypothetical protein
VSRITRVPNRSPQVFAYTPLTFFGAPFQAASANLQIGNFDVFGPTTPVGRPTGLGSSAFARRYWQNHSFVFFSSGY